MSKDINSILAHENTLLKTELEHLRLKHEREIKEVKSQYQSKICDLQEIIEASEYQKIEESERYSLEEKRIQQENFQLRQKLKICEDSKCFIEGQLNKTIEDNSKTLKLKDSLLSKSDSSLLQLREEKAKLEEKINILEAEMDQERLLKQELEIKFNSNNLLLQEVQSRLKESSAIYEKNQEKYSLELEKLQISNHNLEESLKRKEEELKIYVDKECESNKKANEIFVSFEKDINEKYADLRQQYLLEIQQLTEEKNCLSHKIQVLQKKAPAIGVKEGEVHAVLSEKLHTKINELIKVQKENSSLKGKLSLYDELKNSLTKEKEISEKLHKELEEIILHQFSLKEQLSDMQNKFHSMEEKLKQTETQLTSTYSELQEERSKHLKKFVDHKLKEEENVTQLQSRIDDLENQLAKKSSKFLDESCVLNDKLKKYRLLIKKLRYQKDISGLKEKELKAKHFALQEDSVPSYKYWNIKKQFQEIINKHNEFKASLQGLANCHTGGVQAIDYENKLSFISEKLNDLDDAQQETLSALEDL